jgi:hypothetical protein
MRRDIRVGALKFDLAAVAALALVGLATLQACGAPPGARSTAASSESTCADRVAAALTTPAPVAGAWDCLDHDLQNRMHAFAIDGDEGLSTIAFQASRSSETYLGRTVDGGYLYWYRGTYRDGVLAVWLDRQGQVVAFNSMIHPDDGEQSPLEAQSVVG